MSILPSGVSLLGAFDSSELKGFTESKMLARNTGTSFTDLPTRIAEHIIIVFARTSVEPTPSQHGLTSFLGAAYAHRMGGHESLWDIQVVSDDPFEMVNRGRLAWGWNVPIPGGQTLVGSGGGAFTMASMAYRELALLVTPHVPVSANCWHFDGFGTGGHSNITPYGAVPSELQYIGGASQQIADLYPNHVTPGSLRPYHGSGHVFGTTGPRMNYSAITGTPPGLVGMQNRVKGVAVESGAIGRIRLKREEEPDVDWRLGLHLGFAQSPAVAGDDPNIGAPHPLGWQWVYDFVDRLHEIQQLDPEVWPWLPLVRYGRQGDRWPDPGDVQDLTYWLNYPVISMYAIGRQAGLFGGP